MNVAQNLKNALAIKPVRIALSVVLVGGLVYLVGWLAGRRLGKGDQTKYAKGETVNTTWAQQTAPDILSRLFDAFDGMSITIDRKNGALLTLLSLTDGQLRYVSNEYNHQYFNGSTNTLLLLIEGEYVGTFGAELDNKRKVMARMRALDIR